MYDCIYYLILLVFEQVSRSVFGLWEFKSLNILCLEIVAYVLHVLLSASSLIAY